MRVLKLFLLRLSSVDFHGTALVGLGICARVISDTSFFVSTLIHMYTLYAFS